MKIHENLNNLPIQYVNYTQFAGHQEILHETCDFIYVLSGQLMISDEQSSDSYSSDTLRLLNPGCKYLIDAFQKNAVIFLSLNADFVQQQLGTRNMLICDSMKEPGNGLQHMKQLVSMITASCLENSTPDYLVTMSLLYQLLKELRDQNGFFTKTGEGIPAKYQQRVLEITDYIDQNYQNPLTLNTMAEELSLTPQYLSKFFKKYLHTNFKKYLLDKRMFHAHRDLCYTSDPITDISIRRGFSDVSSFSRLFSQMYGENPSVYRRKVLDKQRKNRAVHYSYLPLSVANEKVPDGRSFSAYADITQSNPWNRDFSSLMNIGYARNLLTDSFCHDLLQAAEQLHIRHLRILGLISNAFMPRVLPDYDYYFLDIDRILDFLHHHKFIPLIELTRLPYTYTEEKKTGTASFIPRDKRYLILLEKFLEHIACIYPASWLSEWEFEIWQIPHETNADYVKNFQIIRERIRKYIPSARLGGPGYDSARADADFESLLSEFKAQSVVPDYISAYFSLLTQLSSNHYMISQTKDLFSSRASRLSSLIRQYGLASDFYVTEWTSVPIVLPNTPVQVSSFQAAFICKTALDLLPFCKRIGYWIFKDTRLIFPSSAAQNNISNYWGRALLNNQSFPQPGYYAFQILSHLGDKLIARSSNFCITQSEENHYQVLTYQYSPINYPSLMENDRISVIPKTYSFFEDTPAEEIIIHLQNVKPGTYHVTRLLLDRAHGSQLDLLIGSYEAGNISSSEFQANVQMQSIRKPDYLKQACIPEERSMYFHSDGDMPVELTLSPHIVCLWDIILII